MSRSPEAHRQQGITADAEGRLDVGVDPAALSQFIAGGESQTVEFKETLSSGAQREAMESLVAFANTDGGRVLFGVRDDGFVSGVQIGKDTFESIANKIRQHTYPSLPVSIEQAKDETDRKVFIVEVPRDKPPVVGVYMCSEKPIQEDQEVEARGLQAYRRVGRTNQKVDFMRLRETLPADPRIRLVGRSAYASDNRTTIILRGRAWVEDNSGSAHRITFQCDPPVCGCTESINDLPFPELISVEIPRPNSWFSGHRTVPEMITQQDFFFSCENLLNDLPLTLTLRANYMDDWGLTWQSSWKILIYMSNKADRDYVDSTDGGEFDRRIVTFAPKDRGYR